MSERGLHWSAKGAGLILGLFVLYVLGPRSSLISAEQNGHESDAIKALQGIAAAQSSFYAGPGSGRYGDLTALRDAGLIEGDVSSGTHSGYVFEVAASSEDPAVWLAVAHPQVPGSGVGMPWERSPTGTREFATDQHGWVHFRSADMSGALEPIVLTEDLSLPADVTPVGR